MEDQRKGESLIGFPLPCAFRTWLSMPKRPFETNVLTAIRPTDLGLQRTGILVQR